jgi:starch synthase
MRRFFQMKKILFVASEAVPFIKTGGLADVVGSLPKCFNKEYYDVRVMIPKYLCIKQEWRDKMDYVSHFYMDFMGQSRYVGIMHYEHEGIHFYFIDNEGYFSGPKPYGDWLYDLEKFSFFCNASLSALPVIGFQPDVVHCHDWQTGLIPVYLKDRFRGGEFFCNMKSVFTIHNLKFQGVWDVKTIQRFSGLSDYYFAPDKLEAYKDGNLLKGGVVFADAITTVSDTYAEEIKMPFYGEGLDGLMRARSGSLRGIVNGIDYEDFNPATDSMIEQVYDAKNFRKEKIKNKRALQRELGLEEDDNRMMIGVVSRLTDQKGFDLIQYVMEDLCSDAVQLVVLGTGEERYENMFRHFAWKYPGKVAALIYYSEPMSHKIYAASDAFLMPSLFEPCGLSQLMALRYGTVPIVRETGGLKDTVEPYNEFEGTGTGFSFTNYNAHEMLASVRYAERIYYDKKREWNKLIDRAMAKDYSWNASALKYQELYDWLIGY